MRQSRPGHWVAHPAQPDGRQDGGDHLRLLRALLGKGIEHIVELQMPERKALVREFQIGWFGRCAMDEPMLIRRSST